MKIILLTIFNIFSILLTHGLCQDSLIFIIRVDDIMNRNNTILPRSIEPFENAVNAYNAKITWAVIPHRLIESQNNDGSLTQQLLSTLQNGHSVAQHGYNHFCPVDNSWNHEMFCSGQNVSFSYDYQDSLIVNGMQILIDSLGIQPSSFVPPGHSADSTTYRVLSDRGFDWISTGETTKSYLYADLYNLKPHSEYTWALQPSRYQEKLNQALSNIRWQSKIDGYYCMLFHDYFIRSGYQNGLVIQWTTELLDSLVAYYGDRIQFKTVEQAAQHFALQTTEINKTYHNYAKSFILYDNYPDPFNPATIIKYEIPVATLVDLSVFNITGQRIITLVSEKENAGAYRIKWDASDFPSGIYFYRLQTMSGFRQTKKMVLLR